MFFGYSFSQVKALVVSAVMFGLAMIGIFFAYDPGLTPAILGVLTAVFALVQVFGKPNFNVGEFNKTLAQLEGAVFFALSFIITVPASVEMQIIAAVTALASGIPILLTKNAPSVVPIPAEIDDGIEEVADLPAIEPADPPPPPESPKAGTTPGS